MKAKTKITRWLASEGWVVIGIPVVSAILWNLPVATPLRGHAAAVVTHRVAMTPAIPWPVVLAPVAENPQVLDERRMYALGMIETGNNDFEVGQAGEVSRYQIMPMVWRRYSQSAQYEDPAVATEVARKHWAVLYTHFMAKAGRPPSDFDMYVLWNTRYGYYASKGFKPARLHPVVHDRARYFVNLVKSGRQLAAVSGQGRKA